ncbi:MAG TPA: hypothetical protein PKD24_13540 [Pyrinomonadaceae bacterium]|nr:hypothetical protein [Pyrinomonadaceae bacterium]HMP66512.1 hypothetical protein [Pyrinomonadaceae bacterium]
MKTDTIFICVAAALGVSAAYFFFMGNTDGMFVSAVLGSVAFFLGIRSQVKERNRAREAEEDRLAENGSDER